MDQNSLRSSDEQVNRDCDILQQAVIQNGISPPSPISSGSNSNENNIDKPDSSKDGSIEARKIRQRQIMRNRTKNLGTLYQKIKSKLGLRSDLTQRQTLEYNLERISNYQETIFNHQETIERQRKNLEDLRRENDQLRHQLALNS